ncbi:hypothetical protein BGZ65_004330 [Modicella reniformis]|uniref:Glutamine amidotransferase type-2 domain-containing protein n=1 Tax=Modicella reniformis TaxID=1440133 RepID=A0A9P6IKW1_9FUNG|nr:hypothetical protein BGZ65_004330 [Modicella reniformis]
MCRMLLFKGRQPIQLAHLLTKPGHSIINQAFKPNSNWDSRLQPDGRQRVNGDGFGVGWYESEHDQESGAAPCIFTSVTPAWNNMNLIRLAEKIKSPLVFAHVRSSNAGSVSESNCQPWQYGRLMFMHNGLIADFHLIKCRVQESLSDEIYLSVNGNTDSEWAFAVFLSQLETPCQTEPFCHNVLKEALLKTISKFNTWLQSAGIISTSGDVSYLNFAVTDGVSVVCSRYVNSTAVEAASLYLSSGSKLECYEPGHYRMIKTSAKRVDLVVIASEPLTFDEADWLKVPSNTLVVVTSRMNVLMYPIEDEYQRLKKDPVLMEGPKWQQQQQQQQQHSTKVEGKPLVSITTPIAITGRDNDDNDDDDDDDDDDNEGTSMTPSTPAMSPRMPSHYLPSSPSNSSISTDLSDGAMNDYLRAESLVRTGSGGSSVADDGRLGAADCHDNDNGDDNNEIEEDYRIFPVKRLLSSSVRIQGR